jgi:hypothetical protein
MTFDRSTEQLSILCGLLAGNMPGPSAEFDLVIRSAAHTEGIREIALKKLGASALLVVIPIR